MNQQNSAELDMKTNEITINKGKAKGDAGNTEQNPDTVKADAEQVADKKKQASVESQVKEINGPKGLEPTRYGDWESKGRCYDF